MMNEGNFRWISSVAIEPLDYQSRRSAPTIGGLGRFAAWMGLACVVFQWMVLGASLSGFGRGWMLIVCFSLGAMASIFAFILSLVANPFRSKAAMVGLLASFIALYTGFLIYCSQVC
jgi:hypothetical protein